MSETSKPTSKLYELGEQTLAAADAAREAALLVEQCPWWRPFRRSALVHDMRVKAREMRELARLHTWATERRMRGL